MYVGSDTISFFDKDSQYNIKKAFTHMYFT